VKIAVDNPEFSYVTDNTNEIDSSSAFLLTQQNKKYFHDFKNCKILTPKELIELFGIDKKIKIIGITGTNGKTTTAACIYSIILDLGKKVGLQGTRGCFVNDKRVAKKGLTTPSILETINNLKVAMDSGCEYFVMEVSSHAIAQKRVEGLVFYLKVFTNLTQDHLDFHKTLENYISIKSSFFSDESLKLINKDDKKIRFNPKNCYTYGLENPATYKIVAYSIKDGIEAVLQKIDKLYEFSSSLYGVFNLYNLTASLAAVDLLKISDLETICDVVANFAGVEGRMEIVSHNPLVIVDFAHTPDGMKKVFESLKGRDLVVVFGAGGDRDKTKRAKMGEIARRYAKKVIITSDNPRSENPDDIIKDILEGINSKENLFVQEDRKDAIKLALKMQKESEVLLILGKGDEAFQEIRGDKLPFSDKEVVRGML